MNTFQTCKDTSDIVPLYIPQQLYLKPMAKINISLQLPKMKAGKSISHWEIMEKLRELIKPQEFSILKVSKSTLEFVRFEAEIEIKKKLESIVNKLDNKTIKLKNFSELMRLRSAPAKSDFPNRNIWDGFFCEAKDMNEMKPGERPDTVHLSNLPSKWFVPYHLLDEEDLVPSEKIFYKIFEKFGPIRYVDIPLCDPYRNKMKDHISGIKNCPLEDKTIFEGYVQYKDYMGFTKCMDFLRDMKLVHKDEDEAVSADIKVDFDRSKHLSDASVRRREIVRDRLVKKQKEKEEKEKNELEEMKRQEEDEKKKEISLKKQKEQRRKLREEKRKAAILEKLKIKGADEINAKIAKEEKKLLKVQRKLESIRLIEELFKRIKEKRELEKVNTYNFNHNEDDNELKRYKNTSELQVLNQKQKLHTAIQGRVMLKTVLKEDHLHEFSSSSSDEDAPNQVKKVPIRDEGSHPNTALPPGEMYDGPMWYGYPYHMPPAMYQPPMRGHHAYNMFPRGGRRGFPRGSQYPGQSRGAPFTRRPRGYKSHYRGGYAGRSQYPPEIEEEYIKYFSKFLHSEHDDRGRRSRSRTRRSRSRSYSRRRSYSRHRSYSRSASRNRRSPSKSRSRSRGVNSRSRRSQSRRSSPRSRRSKSRSRSGHRRISSATRRSTSRTRRSTSRTRRSESRSRSASRQCRTSRGASRTRTKSRSRSLKRSRSKDRSRSRNQSSSRNPKCSKTSVTRTPETKEIRDKDDAKKGESESPDRKSVDSSSFISPGRMRRERSKSWSMPRENEERTRSWSQSKEEEEGK